MISVMVLRLVISVLNMLFLGYGWDWVVSLVVGAILLVVGFFSFVRLSPKHLGEQLD